MLPCFRSSVTSNPQCILSAYVCDGYSDCKNGRDENECNGQDKLSSFHTHPNKRLDVKYIKRWLNMNPEGCAAQCLNSKEFTCRSFNYNKIKQMCTLSEDNIGSSGMLESDAVEQNWDYYEAINEQLVCNRTCSNGKCLHEDLICDGKNDCGDNSDESGCSHPNLVVRIVDANGAQSSKGRLQT